MRKGGQGFLAYLINKPQDTVKLEDVRMTEDACIHMWVGGHLDCINGVKYVGRVKYYYENIDLDRFWFENLYSLYGMSGGTCTNVNFYYTPPGHPLDLYSLRLINRMADFAILEMIQSYKDVQIPISIYVEELDDPLLVLDPKGNILPYKMHVKEEIAMQDFRQSQSQGMDEDNGGSFAHNATSEKAFDHKSPDVTARSDFGQMIDEEKKKKKQSEELNLKRKEAVERFFSSVKDLDKGKRTRKEIFYEESFGSDFDDSSDEDYVQAHEPSDDSTNLDKEGTSDVGKHANHANESDGGETDFDSPSNPNRSQLVKKLKKILSNKHTKMQPERDTNEVEAEEWYNDIGDKNKLHSLSEHSDEEDATCKHPYFKEGQNMKNFRLIVGMKFRNTAVFREAFRDNCVRYGYDLDYKK
ncbi:hypothetical protein CDL12_07654 [Handroanthus impetiginosus]|uniref:Uncharacterized protein n=1 Tax=Handroanthus impetiginosus TaxID=429701 RepID=A0A2G9HQ57_9LAMI|nr:hypothetical protein CDL12_07654 [Handroanthus impetiginosus]